MITGCSYGVLARTFSMGKSTVKEIVTETMDVIWEVLQPTEMPIPSRKKFRKIARRFFEVWGFPHCLGAIDGKHVAIRKPKWSGSKYFNYKKFFSIVLQAVVDADYRFIFIDVGGYGRISDGGILKASKLCRALKKNLIKFPKPDKLPNCRLTLPYFFVGDGAYPLMENLMKPFPGKSLPRAHAIFNKALSRARVVVEIAFGHLCQRWPIFYTTINKSPKLVQSIVKCACVLHNFIINKESLFADSKDDIKSEDVPFEALDYEESDFVIGFGKEVREVVVEYINKKK